MDTVPWTVNRDGEEDARDDGLNRTTFSLTHDLLGVANLAPLLSERPRISPKFTCDMLKLATNSAKKQVRIFQQLSVLPSERR